MRLWGLDLKRGAELLTRACSATRVVSYEDELRTGVNTLTRAYL